MESLVRPYGPYALLIARFWCFSQFQSDSSEFYLAVPFYGIEVVVNLGFLCKWSRVLTHCDRAMRKVKYPPRKWFSDIS